MRRAALVLSGVALTLATSMTPADAFTRLGSQGTFHEPNVVDESSSPGALCVYRDGAGTVDDTLAQIRVPKFFTHAPYRRKTWVGYQMTVLRNGTPHFTTKLVKAKANLEEVAFFGPTTWKTNRDLTGEYQVVLKLTYYNQKGKVKGTYRGRIDVYNQKLGTAAASHSLGDPGDAWDYTDASTPGHCTAVYAPPVLP
jgi:hypothetical protein